MNIELTDQEAAVLVARGREIIAQAAESDDRTRADEAANAAATLPEPLRQRLEAHGYLQTWYYCRRCGFRGDRFYAMFCPRCGESL